MVSFGYVSIASVQTVPCVSGRRSGTPAAGNEDPGGGVERGEDAGGQRETQGGA